jgi:hypothetical protein
MLKKSQLMQKKSHFPQSILQNELLKSNEIWIISFCHLEYLIGFKVYWLLIIVHCRANSIFTITFCHWIPDDDFMDIIKIKPNFSACFVVTIIKIWPLLLQSSFEFTSIQLEYSCWFLSICSFLLNALLFLTKKNYRLSGWFYTRWGEMAQSLKFKYLYKSHCKSCELLWTYIIWYPFKAHNTSLDLSDSCKEI